MAAIRSLRSRLRRVIQGSVGWLALTIPLVTTAADLISVETGQIDGTYTLRIDMQLHSPAGQVRAVLGDYNHLDRLNPTIIESRRISAPGDVGVRVFTRAAGCILFYCDELTRVEEVHEPQAGILVARIVPELSDFESGQAIWQIQPAEKGTRLIYQATMVPRFFIPPLLGGYLVEQKLKTDAIETFRRIECAARATTRLAVHQPSVEPEVEARRQRTC